jgi:hypothetical protein
MSGSWLLHVGWSTAYYTVKLGAILLTGCHIASPAADLVLTSFRRQSASPLTAYLVGA